MSQTASNAFEIFGHSVIEICFEFRHSNFEFRGRAQASAPVDGVYRPRAVAFPIRAAYNLGMPTPKEERLAAARLAAETTKQKKLHVIAERRAKAAKMNKTDFIAAIVKGHYRPITAADLAAEPAPE